jgi:hypothetical protein
MPVKSYDFQAPLGEFGEMKAQLRKLKLIHYFLRDFGAELAPAAAIQPQPHPASPQDISVLRASARLDGESGFVFVNNYIRERQMPEWPGTQFELRASGKTILVPASPFTVPANSFFHWPVNMECDGINLEYATAQPILKTRNGKNTYAFFFAIPGIPKEFAFPAESRRALLVARGTLTEQDGLLRIQGVAPGRDVAITVHGKSGDMHFVLLSAEDADNLWSVTIDGVDRLALTSAQVFTDGKQLTLRQIGNSTFDAALFPATRPAASKEAVLQGPGKLQGIFEQFVWRTPERKVLPEIVQIRPIGKAPLPLLGPKASFRQSAVAMTPKESSFAQAGEWQITIPLDALDGLSDLFLAIRYQGDEARLLSGNRLLTDNFYNGATWRIGLKRFMSAPTTSPFLLQLLPLDEKARIFFEPGSAPDFGKDGQAGSLESIEALPEYKLNLSLPGAVSLAVSAK